MFTLVLLIDYLKRYFLWSPDSYSRCSRMKGICLIRASMRASGLYETLTVTLKAPFLTHSTGFMSFYWRRESPRLPQFVIAFEWTPSTSLWSITVTPNERVYLEMRNIVSEVALNPTKLPFDIVWTLPRESSTDTKQDGVYNLSLH